MTNVKLKLMFLLLNALFTSDFVHSRPTDNTTEIYSFNVTEEYNIPVEVNGDTLVVASDETPEQTNMNSKIEMEAIVTAEQGRDESILDKNSKDPTTLEIPKDDAAGIEKQLNVSSPYLEGIIDAETGREEAMTDILFRVEEAEFDGPRFEYLVAAKNDTNATVADKLADSEGKRTDYVELVAVGSKVSENRSSYSQLNVTVHVLENDVAPDTIVTMFSGLTDAQTVFMACFATLFPLFFMCCTMLLLRCICRRWFPRFCRIRKLPTESESSEERPDTPQPLQSIPEAADADREDEDMPANGSIITMTLKNNHLIVETEEGIDVTRNGRETKMKYSPDNDGIFVVEVQQSTAYRVNHKPNTPTNDPQVSTNQALVHRVPDEATSSTNLTLELDDVSDKSSTKFDNARALALSSTGLSISDLSMSSANSHNASYSYGSQTGYEQGPFGYPIYNGYDIPKEPISNEIIHENSRDPLILKTPSYPDRPVVTAAIFKQDSIIGNDVLQGPGYCIEGSTDGPLLSDVQAREVSLQNLHDKMEKNIENGVVDKKDSPKKILQRADTLPVEMDEEKPCKNKNGVMEAICEEGPDRELLKGKRASLPIIKTEMYDCVKEMLVPMGSPEFGRLANDLSPSDSCEPPMITISEEIDLECKIEDNS